MSSYPMTCGPPAGGDAGKETEGEDAVSLKNESKSEAQTTVTDKITSASKNQGGNPPQPIGGLCERQDTVHENEIRVTFEDIGAMDEIKESLQELVVLPLRRPDLFKGGLLKPCRGILLFGPEGTGKTMLARAVASEAGARFINISMSTMTSNFLAPGRQNVQAVFNMAARASPSIIFMDEIDSLFAPRSGALENAEIRKIKHDFMAYWDLLWTRSERQIIVLASTNRPFDIEEAFLKRFDRRIMVSLPSVKCRERILKTILSKVKTYVMDFKELASMTKGYTGSDLKKLCEVAAYGPVRDLMRQEKEKKKAEHGTSSKGASVTKHGSKEDRGITLRPLNMEDMNEAEKQVFATFVMEGSMIAELNKWNDLHGEGCSKKKQRFSYYY